MSCSFCAPVYEEPIVPYAIGIRVNAVWYDGEEIERILNNNANFERDIKTLEGELKSKDRTIKKLSKKLGLPVVKKEDEDGY